MNFLEPPPPQTLGVASQVPRGASTNLTGETAGESETGGSGIGVASRRIAPRHFQSGVVSASKNELPRTTRDEPRKRRRKRFIDSDHRQRESLDVTCAH